MQEEREKIKVADNERIDNEKEISNYREVMNDIENRIDSEKDKMKKLDDMEELFVSLNKNISKCVELLHKSIKGKNIANKLNSIEENNQINFKKSIGNIEIEREDVKNNLINLYDKKESFQQMNREKNTYSENNNENKEKEEPKLLNPNDFDKYREKE